MVRFSSEIQMMMDDDCNKDVRTRPKMSKSERGREVETEEELVDLEFGKARWHESQTALSHWALWRRVA